MFKSYNYNLNLVAEPFANLKYRDRTVLLLFRNSQGKYIFERASTYYPDGISRLLGGGVDKGEEVINAAIREMKEETGIDLNRDELDELVQINVEGVYKTALYKTQIFVYFLNSRKDNFKEGYDASDLIAYSEDEYKELVKRYLQLKADQLKTEGDNTFSWGDYGKVYGFVHEVALNELLERGL